MNNIKTLTIVAIFMAATLVVGTLAATSTIARTQTAFAFSKNKKGDENSKNGNTITALKCQNKGSASGFDTATNQECENLICTHPGNNTTCVEEGAVAVTPAQTPPIKLTCERCFMKFLTQEQILSFAGLADLETLADLCQLFQKQRLSEQ